ncbi:RNA methyltransferase [Hyphomicrobium sp.]|uniref:RNA methyltransferase n=1 Tax=Hyphomicrobium sp. TaxID=82 RepID=UPI002E33A045|nr:RNA methyltransferase [Hyphomicrobium sp.]HEX2843207.1 RNA methyltransferase [Hyphomicrobium sp.]
MNVISPVTREVEIAAENGERVPVVSGYAMPIATLVHACHEKTIDEGLKALGANDLDRGALDHILTYCAELRCEGDAATCPGCKRRTEVHGIDTLDEFIARHKEIVVGDGAVRLVGQGTETLTTPALAALEKTWSGENYWFWARRVLRKLRHGIRRAHIQGEPVAGPGETPAVLLVEPQLADNIGMVARAMANFGLDDLRLVAPRDGWPNEKARIAASGANYVIDDATAYPTLEASLGDLTYVVATTARQRPLKKPVLTPEEAISELRERISRGERCGILFGRERNGLETGELANADALVMIPVNSRFASLNLAQAVLLLGYAWMRESGKGTLGRVTTYEQPISTGLNLGADRLATKEELFGFMGHLENELDRLGFFNPIEKRPSVVQNLRTMFTRMALTEQEVRSLRGIVATLSKGKGHSRKPST